MFFGGSGPIHYLRAYAKAYASLRGLRGAPASQLPGAHLRGQTLSSSVEVHCGSSSWKIETFQCKCSVGSSGSKIKSAAQARIQHLSKDLAARKGLRPQNALKAYANAYAGPTRSLREDCRTNPCPSICVAKHKAADNA